MTDVWDIAQYIEAHPDNHDQRWRLAKKLYMAWEYRLALEHLQVLKNEWDKKINVSRYLAATYYRLARFAEAIKELEHAIDLWPHELGLQEQLARTLDVAGRREEAALVWKKIADTEPDHPFARRAVEHLQGQVEEAPTPPSAPQPLRQAEKDATDEKTCPHCGSMNSPEFQRCWQCHGSMSEREEVPVEEPDTPARAAGLVHEEGPWGLISGILTVCLLAGGVYFTLGAYNAHVVGVEGVGVPTSLVDFLAGTFFWTKVILGGLALVMWPLVWRVSAVFVGLDEVYNDILYRCGWVMAGFTYLLAWLPGSLIVLTLVLAAVASAGLAFTALKAPPVRALAVWAVQGGVMLIVVTAVVVGRHGLGPIGDFAALSQFPDQPGPSSVEQIGATPLAVDLMWESSGSTWLDESASTVAFVGTLGSHSKRIFVELIANGETLVFHEYSETQFAFEYGPIEPGTAYTLRLSGEDGVEASVGVRGVLKLSSNDRS